MNKTKKAIIYLGVLLILLIAGYFGYMYFTKPEVKDYTEIEEAGLNNISGYIEAVEGNDLRVMAQVPENFTPFSQGGYNYINKRYLIKTTDSTVILIWGTNDEVNQEFDLAKVKAGDSFDAISTTNIMNANIIEVSQLIIYKQ